MMNYGGMQEMAGAVQPMAVWKIVLIALLVASAVAAIAGVVLGKHLVKRSQNAVRPLFSPKERIIYSGVLFAGAVLIVLGIFIPRALEPKADENGMMNPGIGMEGFVEGQMMDGGEAGDGNADMQLDDETISMNREDIAGSDGEQPDGDAQAQDIDEPSGDGSDALIEIEDEQPE